MTSVLAFLLYSSLNIFIYILVAYYEFCDTSVSYTHLDVYKRQACNTPAGTADVYTVIQSQPSTAQFVD